MQEKANITQNTKDKPTEFYCYSKKLQKFIEKHNVLYIRDGVHFKTNNPFWVYKSGKIIDLLLEEYRINNTTE